MSDALLNAGRQTLMLELGKPADCQNASAMTLFVPPILSSTAKAK